MAYKKGPGHRHHALALENIGKDDPTPLPTMDYGNYNQSIALLVLNASIIEGLVRSVLSQSIFDDYDKQVKKEVEEGRDSPSKPQLMLQKFQSEVEIQGGWEKLKEQFLFYFDVSIDKMLSEDVKESINALFVLRNVFAHGTAIVHPKEPMDETMKTEYPYSWYRRLQRARVYLKKHFGHDDIFENLAEYAVPEHFLGATKLFFDALEKEFGELPSRASDVISKLRDYSFGYISLSR